MHSGVRFKQITNGLGIGGVVALALFALCGALGARLNTTPSLPVGLYWRVDSPAEMGRYVMFCPPQNKLFEEARKRGYIGGGICPGNYNHLIKRIMATSGDIVSVTDEGVSINNVFMPLSQPLRNDSSGSTMPRPMPHLFTLVLGELLLMSDVNDKSFDARYFGVIDTVQIKDVIRPVLVWK